MTLAVSNNSIFIESQLPEYIRSDSNYATFVAFLNAYYEWLETTDNVTYHTKRVQNYLDVDSTTDEFLQYFRTTFLPYIPKDSMADPRKLAKLAKEFYKNKGTEKSFRFLFRALYGKEIDLYLKEDNVIRASGGEWFIPRKVTIDSISQDLSQVIGKRILGKTSKTYATIEDIAIGDFSSEVYINTPSGTFIAGETIIVVDVALNPVVLDDGTNIEAKIIGSVTGITLDGRNRGKLYKVGDPVIVYGGHNPAATTPIDAVAEVSYITAGSLDRIFAGSGGYGYTLSPNTSIEVIGDGVGANIQVNLIDYSIGKIANVTIGLTTIAALSPNTTAINAANYGLKTGATTNAGNTIANATSSVVKTTGGISGINVYSRGSGYSYVPTIVANSNILIGNTNYSITKIGALGPVQIENAGTGYANGDFLVFTGGSGFGANANVKNIHSVTGAIQEIDYRDVGYGLGGMHYGSTSDPNKNAYPTITITSSGGAGASVFVDGILGAGAEFIATTDAVGVIQKVAITKAGTDYISQPTVTFKVADLWLNYISDTSTMPAKDELVYQGVNESSATFKAYVYTVSDYTGGGYTLRVRDYIGNANNQQQLSIVRDSGNVTLYMSNTTDAFFTANASHIYGDGSAKGSAQFTNFTSITSENGIYTSSRSLLNEIGVVIEDIDNNAFTYELLVEDSLQKYKNVLLGLLHPAGTHYITKNVLKANSVTTIILDTAQDLTYTYSAMTANMSLSGTDVSTNTIVITNAPAYIDTIFEPSDYIQLIDSTSKINVYAKINSVDRTSNTINVESQLPLLYNNVAFGRANSGYNYINVSTITTTYNLINNGEYSDYAHWLKDIVQIGDQLKLGTNSYGYVQNVDYTNNVIYMTNNYSSAIANGNVTIKKIVSTNNITYVKNLGFARFLTEDSYLIVTENNEVLYL